MGVARWCEVALIACSRCALYLTGRDVISSALYVLSNWLEPGCLHWPTSVAFATQHPLLAAAFFHSLQLEYPFEAVSQALVRLVFAHATVVAVLLRWHAPRLWQCRVLSMCLQSYFFSDSALTVCIGLLQGYLHPCFPPEGDNASEFARADPVEARAIQTSHPLSLLFDNSKTRAAAVM